MTKIESAMPGKPESLETLIDNTLQGVGTMTLADLINLVARPQYSEGFRRGEGGASQSVTHAVASVEHEQSRLYEIS